MSASIQWWYWYGRSDICYVVISQQIEMLKIASLVSVTNCASKQGCMRLLEIMSDLTLSLMFVPPMFQAKGKKQLFVQLVLDNIWSLYDAVVTRRCVKDVERLPTILIPRKICCPEPGAKEYLNVKQSCVKMRVVFVWPETRRRWRKWSHHLE